MRTAMGALAAPAMVGALMALAGGCRTEPEPSQARMVVIETTKGEIVAELYPESAPRTVRNFLTLADEGYYDDMPWHRVAEGFVIQTGDGPDRPTIPDEVNRHKHRPGSLAMAKPGSDDPARMSAPNSASSQFYITIGSREETRHLNAEYTVFGRVQDGMEVARRITQQDKVKAIRILSEE